MVPASECTNEWQALVLQIKCDVSYLRARHEIPHLATRPRTKRCSKFMLWHRWARRTSVSLFPVVGCLVGIKVSISSLSLDVEEACIHSGSMTGGGVCEFEQHDNSIELPSIPHPRQLQGSCVCGTAYFRKLLSSGKISCPPS